MNKNVLAIEEDCSAGIPSAKKPNAIEGEEEYTFI
jgi:hypothetical protein